MKKLVMLLMLLVCTSCSALPAEERAFAVALCVEKQDGLWQVHARIPTYQTGGGYQTISGRASTLETALADMDASAPMHLHLSQLRMLVMHQDLGTEMSAALQRLSERMDVRPSCAVAVTALPGKQLMEALKPAAGMRLSKSIDVMLDTRMEQGRVLPSALSDVTRMGERQTPVLPVLSVTAEGMELSGGYTLMDEPVLLTETEIALLAVLREGTSALRLSLPEGMAEVRDAKVKVCLDSAEAATVSLSLTMVSAGFSPEGLEALLAKKMVSLLERLSKARCDVLGLGHKVIMQMEDMAQWHDQNWPQRLRQLRWTVSVGVSGPA